MVKVYFIGFSGNMLVRLHHQTDVLEVAIDFAGLLFQCIYVQEFMDCTLCILFCLIKEFGLFDYPFFDEYHKIMIFFVL